MRKRAPLPAIDQEEPAEALTSVVEESSQPAPSSQINGAEIQRKLIIARALSMGATKQRAIEALQRYEPAISESQARRIYYAVLHEWRDDYQAEMPFLRAAQLRRIQTDLTNMRLEREMTPEEFARKAPGRERATWADIRGHEREYAKIAGTLAPVDVRVLDVAEELRETLAEVVGEYSLEEMTDLLGDGEVIEVEAEAAQ